MVNIQSPQLYGNVTLSSKTWPHKCGTNTRDRDNAPLPHTKSKQYAIDNHFNMVTFCVSNGMTPWKSTEIICGEDGDLTQSKEASKQLGLRYILHRLKFKVIKSGNHGSTRTGQTIPLGNAHQEFL
jgi:hypothetical protein